MNKYKKYRPSEWAKIKGVTRQTVYNWIKEGKINHSTECGYLVVLIPIG